MQNVEDSIVTARPQNRYRQYHAHVYFDANTVEQARSLCDQAGQTFGVAVGQVHEKRVGPHPHWSCQISFDQHQFETLIPWLEEHRQGLNILVHGLTGNDLEDHTTHASWLGDPSELNLELFRTKTH